MAPALWQLALLWSARLGDEDKAFAFAEKARPAYPSDLMLAKILGQGAYRHGDFLRSVQILQEASQRTSDAEVFYYLGVDYYKLKRNAESKKSPRKSPHPRPRGQSGLRRQTRPGRIAVTPPSQLPRHGCAPRKPGRLARGAI